MVCPERLVGLESVSVSLTCVRVVAACAFCRSIGAPNDHRSTETINRSDSCAEKVSCVLSWFPTIFIQMIKKY